MSRDWIATCVYKCLVFFPFFVFLVVLSTEKTRFVRDEKNIIIIIKDTRIYFNSNVD